MTKKTQSMCAVSADAPLMRAWRSWLKTADYSIAHDCAVDPQHTDGALWEAFSKGFRAGQRL